jgi:predicted TIM-barrel fold metal-dependent hydrolase
VLPESARIISVDDHIIEPPHLWESRLPARYREAGPRVVRDEHGLDYWEYAGTRTPNVGVSTRAGKSYEEVSTAPVNFSTMLPGAYDPVARLEDMDEDGVYAQLGFPQFARFAGHRFLEGDDRELAKLCVEAYNDFQFDEWCAAAPNRYIPMVIIPQWDPELSAAEIRRTAALGARAIAFSENPTLLGLPSWHTDYWDPVFAAAEEASMPLCLHIGSSSQVIDHSADSPYPVHVSVVGCNSMVAAVDLVYSPVFEKFPNLLCVMSEGEAGWAPHALERMDWAWERHRYHAECRLTSPPSEVFKEHIYLCVIGDDHAVANRHTIGVDHLLWESDYPHMDTTWPHTRKILEATLADIPDDEAVMIAETNARRVFRWDD